MAQAVHVLPGDAGGHPESRAHLHICAAKEEPFLVHQYAPFPAGGHALLQCRRPPLGLQQPELHQQAEADGIKGLVKDPGHVLCPDVFAPKERTQALVEHPPSHGLGFLPGGIRQPLVPLQDASHGHHREHPRLGHVTRERPSGKANSSGGCVGRGLSLKEHRGEVGAEEAAAGIAWVRPRLGPSATLVVGPIHQGPHEQEAH
mmetsp:Transcript_24913/g.69775  ORF Transcript_24913/g.69775 Transcript_24913/m.69775 type:complete len:203 (+) Transcript_24913:2925-3533(+)